MKNLARELVSRMPQLTARRHTELALSNARQNRPQIHQTIRDLAPGNRMESAIIVSGGPSLHRKNSVGQILESDYEGVIISVDGALGHCLRNSLVPDYVVILDPHPTRVIRWFGDPDLTSTDDDDYFRRQEMDPYLCTQEIARNQELVDLVDKHGPQIKAVLATSCSPRVAQRCADAGMVLFWWNPLLDDYKSPGSVTRELYRSNKVPCMASGGNVGTASWVFAHAIMGFEDIALVGMDFGYAPGMSQENTQYYKEIVELFGAKAGNAFIDVDNPYLNETWFTDPAYYWYREGFLDMAPRARCRTFNCTEGGILTGDGITFIPLREFLSSHS